MAEFTALGLVALVAIGGLIYLGTKPELQPTPPAPPPPAAVAIQPPVFDVVRVDAQGNTVLAGRAAPGATVTIKSGAVVLGSTKADAQGAFVLLPTNPLAAGPAEISLSETLPNGTVIAGSGTASIDVPAGAGKALAVLSGPNGSTVRLRPGAATRHAWHRHRGLRCERPCDLLRHRTGGGQGHARAGRA